MMSSQIPYWIKKKNKQTVNSEGTIYSVLTMFIFP